jgi:hypothetical protein
MVPACGEISSRSNFNNGLCAAVIFCDIAKLRRQPGYGLRAPLNSIPRYDQPKGSMSADQIGRGWTDLQKFNVSASKQQFSFELSRRARLERHYTSTLETTRSAVLSDRQAPIIPPGERRWDSEASSEAAGRRE